MSAAISLRFCLAGKLLQLAVMAWLAALPLTINEQRLILDLLQIAIAQAEAPRDTAMRRGARAWLRNSEFAQYSARQAFEAVGVDYGEALAKLTQRWEAQDE